MAQSFISNHQHIVFSTKARETAIPSDEQKRLWAYVGGIAKGVDAIPMAIGGMPDHLHVLVSLPADMSIAKFVNVLKSNSSKWMNEHGHHFGWQHGYAAFSVSASSLGSVTEYIDNQAEHHKRRDYRAEFIALLKKHNVVFDPRYVFD
jgi:REP-associated tyrosine transposase